MKKINKKIRNGFSMVELLFVMLIMAGLAAIAIPNLSAGEKSSVITSMTSDTKNMISAVKSYIVVVDNELPSSFDEQDESHSYEHGDEMHSIAVPVTEGNQAIVTGKPDDCINGFEIVVSDLKGRTDKTVVYNSCTDNAPRLVTP
jgi:prepilin-type N-terminal cleavage/methylation domain-containing protein